MPSSLFVQEQLNRVSNVVIETEFPEYQMASGNLLNISQPYGAGVDTYSFDILTKVGQTAVIANGSEDIPNVNAFTERRYGKFYTIANSYQYTIQDLEHAEFAGTSLNSQMAVAAREISESKFDEICHFGDENYDLEGIVDYPNVPTEVATDPGSGTEWANKNPSQIYDDLRKLASDMRNATKGKYFPTTLIMPQKQFDLISETPYPDNQGSETILSFFLKTQRLTPTGVQQVFPVPRLEGAFSGGADGMIGFTRRPDRQEIMLGMDFTQEQPQLDSLTYKVITRMRVGGVVVYRPYSVRQLTGI